MYRVPHAGAMRRVYPGFVRLSASFMSMKPERHKQSFRSIHEHLEHGRVEEAATIQNFDEEYLAVNDLPAGFYLETVEMVFQTCDLPRGVLTYQGRTVNPAAIRGNALMTVEGERDGICSVGQTVAAQALCTNVRPCLKTHRIQTGVGHHGVFGGRKWNQQIHPRMRDMIHSTGQATPCREAQHQRSGRASPSVFSVEVTSLELRCHAKRPGWRGVLSRSLKALRGGSAPTGRFLLPASRGCRP